MFGLKNTSQTIVEPVALADMKAHLTIDAGFTGDDALIQGMISAARQDAEDYTARSLAVETWLLTLECFPAQRITDSGPSRSDFNRYGGYTFGGYRSMILSQVIELPQPPLVSVQSIKYTDLNNTVQTLDPSTYQVDTVSEPGRLLPLPGAIWPITMPGVLNAVQISYTAGTASVTANVVAAIKLRAAALYANREEYLAGVVIAHDDFFYRMLGSQGRANLFGYVRH